MDSNIEKGGSSKLVEVVTVEFLTWLEDWTPSTYKRKINKLNTISISIQQIWLVID